MGDNDTITDTNMHVVSGGELLVEGNANINLSGTLTVGANGQYEAVQGATDVTALLMANTVEIIGGSCSPAVDGGAVILTDKMTLATSGDLVMQGSAEQGCMRLE